MLLEPSPHKPSDSSARAMMIITIIIIMIIIIFLWQPQNGTERYDLVRHEMINRE